MQDVERHFHRDYAAKRMYEGGVCSTLTSIQDHIDRHNLGIDPKAYLSIADSALQSGLTPDERTYYVTQDGTSYRVILDGIAKEEDGRQHRIARSVVKVKRIPEIPKQLEAERPRNWKPWIR